MLSEQNSFQSNSFRKNNTNSSTEVDDNSYHTIDPIHSSFQESFSIIKSKKSPQKPAFGTTASRQIRQLVGNKQSDIVAYSRLNYQKNQKYHDRYEELKAKLTPFMSTSGRFANDKIKHPGPGQYSFPQIFKNQNHEKKPQHGAMFCPFKRWQNRENKSCEIKPIQESSNFYLNNKENHLSGNFELQQKIKKKREQMKQKMMRLKQHMKKPQQSFKPMLKRMGYSQNNEKILEAQNQSPTKKRSPQKQSPKGIDLKHLTGKYLPKMEFQFQREQYRTGAVMKNFKEKYNNQPAFITKNEALFSSYITKNESPGPGFYQKRTKKTKKRASLSVRNFLM